MAYTSEPANGETPDNAGLHDNYLKSASAGIIERFGRAQEANRATLETLRDIGDTLTECRDTLGTPQKFNAWAEAQNFPFAKAWRARLMQLATNWDAIMEAVEAAPEGKRKWSVDGVITLWSNAKKAAEAPSEAGEGGEGGEGEGQGDGGSAEAKETKTQKLERMLREALERNEALAAEIEALKQGRSKAKAKPEAEAPKPGSKVSAADRAKAKAIWGLYERPGTEGEGQAAKGRLDALAEKNGMSFEDFKAACGL